MPPVAPPAEVAAGHGADHSDVVGTDAQLVPGERRLDPLARRHAALNRPEPDGTAHNRAEHLFGLVAPAVARGLQLGRLARVQISAVDPDDLARNVADGGNHAGRLAKHDLVVCISVSEAAIIEARVEPDVPDHVGLGKDAAPLQVCLGLRSRQGQALAKDSRCAIGVALLLDRLGRGPRQFLILALLLPLPDDFRIHGAGLAFAPRRGLVVDDLAGRHEGHVLDVHDQRDSVAARIAPAAVEHLLGWLDRKAVNAVAARAWSDPLRARTLEARAHLGRDLHHVDRPRAIDPFLDGRIVAHDRGALL